MAKTFIPVAENRDLDNIFAFSYEHINIFIEHSVVLSGKQMSNSEMNNLRRNFILRFANTLEPQELVRIGGPNVPLEVVPVNEDQNGNAIGNPDEPVPLRVAFRLSGGEIVPGLTYGKRDEINSICLLSIHLCVLIEALCEFL